PSAARMAALVRRTRHHAERAAVLLRSFWIQGGIHVAARVPLPGRVTMSQSGLGSRLSRRALLRTMPLLLGVPALVLSAACRAQAPTAPTASQGAAPAATQAPAAATGATQQAAPATAAPAVKPAAPTAAPPQLAATTTTGN